MDEITDQAGGLSLTAKAWTPGQGFAPTPKAAAAPKTSHATRQVSSTSAEGAGSAGGGWNSAAAGGSSWGGECTSHAPTCKKMFLG